MGPLARKQTFESDNSNLQGKSKKIPVIGGFELSRVKLVTKLPGGKSSYRDSTVIEEYDKMAQIRYGKQSKNFATIIFSFAGGQ